MQKNAYPYFSFVGYFLLVIVWYVVKLYGVDDRYLPSFYDVFIRSISDIKPNVAYHTMMTFYRLIVGYILGIIIGILIGLVNYRFKIVNSLITPSIQSLRSIPPIATVPFFIIWFGFSDVGKFILIILAVGLNISITCNQILSDIEEKYVIMFKTFKLKPNDFILSFALPTILEKILPTLRFSLSTALGIVIVSELIGTQEGLGYLIQTSRSSYSTHVIFLCTLILGVLNVIIDFSLIYFWKKLIFWNNEK